MAGWLASDPPSPSIVSAADRLYYAVAAQIGVGGIVPRGDVGMAVLGYREVRDEMAERAERARGGQDAAA